MNRITPFEALNQGWTVIHDPQDRGRREKWFEGVPQEGAAPAQVPGYVHLSLPDCPGIAWYQLDFETAIRPDDDHAAFLCFDMADFLCEVWLNGQNLGLHRGTENPFSFDCTKALRPGAANRLIARVSKPHTEDVDGYTFQEIPHRNQLPAGLRPGACYNGYGLCGAVTLKLLPRARVDDLYVVGNTKTGAIDAALTLVNDYPAPVTASVALCACEARTGDTCADETFTVTLQPGETVIRRALPVAQVRLWDVNDPFLYAVEAEVSTSATGHRVTKKCGFRTFEVGPDGYFYLNGRRILVRCSHTGNCMPESTWNISRDHNLLRRDFAMAKAAGFNMLRFISGAALPEQLDLCDELGLMIYEEPVSGWLQGDGPRAKDIYQYDLLTMIKRDRSHPCVTIWGLLNETQATAPWGDVCRIAQNSIPEVRALDETRLILFNSGRFDNDPRIGSLCNPFSHRWECLWDGEDESLPGVEPAVPGDPGPTRRRLGDKHYYPTQPHSREDIAFFRAIGSDTRRPFFLSEYGVGSLFDVIWVSRVFEQWRSDPRYPDVAMVRRMTAAFEADLRRYGFDREFPFPIDIMRESQRLHNRHRQTGFDIFRANPWLNGMSLTGLLDHSICGEGLWTFMREWKTGIADTLQEGFAPLRWCLFLNDMHLYSGKPFTIEGVLGNEDVLEARDYPIGLKIDGPDGIVWEDSFTLSVTPEDLKGMAVPVFKKELSLDLKEGEYTLCAELLEGAAAAGGRLHFYVSEDEKSAARAPEVVGIHLGAEAEALLRRKGVKVISADEARGPALAVVGYVPEDEREAVWQAISSLLEKGATVFLASRLTAVRDGDYSGWRPIGHRPQSLPASPDRAGWLYHKEYLARRKHPYFKDLPTGMMNWDYYRYIICGAYFVQDDAEPAAEVSAMACGVGEVCESGYEGGMELCAYAAGKGRLILSAFQLLENLNTNPAADRLFLNIIGEEYARLRGV